MALYCYVKAKPTYIQKPQQRRTSSSQMGLKMFVSTTLSFAGLFLIMWVSYPIVAFEITSRFKYPSSPSTHTDALAKEVTQTVLGTTDGTAIDYTKAHNWFPNVSQSNETHSGQIYTLTIPKLRIFDATVRIAGENLDKSLIQYGGTGLPGDYGTAVIFGHSILPQFYNPQNYKSIFSLLPTLKEGDEIFIKFDGITYKYGIVNMRVTTPDDVSVLEQRYDASYIRLITCVPPGTYWKRLSVTARLEPI